uniref:Beta-defensin-like domain-containing protein n=1 Tax=Zonotrichia albicollis TaxID=44394 RepID=A0A8D2NFU7_ZONAL
MKILFLLFPLILLLVQGAAGNALGCWRRGGFCSWHSCSFSTRFVGICAGESFCCKR